MALSRISDSGPITPHRFGLTVLFAAVGLAAGSFLSDPSPLFRKPDSKGLRCAACHSPDGIELTAYGFARRDLIRRAARHLSRKDADKLVRDLERSHPFAHPLSPTSDRPLQPGGRLLPGATPFVRDAAFGDELAKLFPALDAGPLSKTKALRLRNALLRLDPRRVPVGIPFDRLSEDGFHGAQHATVADWIPDIPLPVDDHFFDLEDAYLARPDTLHLKLLDSDVMKMRVTSNFEALSQAKFRSLLLLQDAIRKYGRSGALLDHIRLIGHGNPFWDVAEVGHNTARSDARYLGMTADVHANKPQPISEQMRGLRLPWFWAGWALDPSLSHLPPGLAKTTTRADYFTHFLWEDGPYPIHMGFMLTKRLIDAGYDANASTRGFPRHFELQYSEFLQNGRLVACKGARLHRLVGNMLRLGLWLLDEDLGRTGACLRPESQLYEIREMRDYFAKRGNSSDLSLCDAVATRLRSARVDGR